MLPMIKLTQGPLMTLMMKCGMFLGSSAQSIDYLEEEDGLENGYMHRLPTLVRIDPVSSPGNLQIKAWILHYNQK